MRFALYTQRSPPRLAQQVTRASPLAGVTGGHRWQGWPDLLPLRDKCQSLRITFVSLLGDRGLGLPESFTDLPEALGSL